MQNNFKPTYSGLFSPQSEFHTVCGWRRQPHVLKLETTMMSESPVCLCACLWNIRTSIHSLVMSRNNITHLLFRLCLFTLSIYQHTHLHRIIFLSTFEEKQLCLPVNVWNKISHRLDIGLIMSVRSSYYLNTQNILGVNACTVFSQSDISIAQQQVPHSVIHNLLTSL